MNDLAALLTSFDVSILFTVAERIANTLSSTLTPVLLLIAIYVRLMETQIDSLTGGGKFGTAVKDMVLWTAVLASYWGITNLVFGFFNPVYAWFDSFGSLATTMASFSKIMAQNKAALDANGLTLTGVISTPYALVAMLFYYGSLIIVAFLSAFLKIANVLVVCVAFVWGFIAIPMGITKSLNVLKGWGLLCALALVWPIIQGLMTAMFAMIFLNSANTLMTITDTDATVRAANIMMLFSVMHLLLGAVLVSAPFIANALVSNTSAVSGIVMPFVAAATAAGVATIKGGQAKGQIPGGSGGLGGGGSKIAGSNNTYRTPTARNATAAFQKNNTPPVAGGGSATNVSASTSAPMKVDQGASGGPGMEVKRKDFSAQQRRGVFVNQTRNKGTKA